MSPSLIPLLTLMSPAFPVGAFAYSHGLEYAVRARVVGDADAVLDWIETLLRYGTGWCDLLLFAEAHRAAAEGDEARLAGVGELALALSGSAERRLETIGLGMAFRQASRPWEASPDDGDVAVAYPVAVGQLAGRLGLALDEALAAFAHGFAANLVAAAVRLVPLGQSQAVALLRRLEPTLVELADKAVHSDLDALGSAALFSEISAMRHETQSPRIFRS
ncbi:urease accessory protein UreF [Consotaella salsifontis]|uniref:Urease accessory protein UreF n=1 Tax=Consotaella salsifontis TaxID=1365950 RepID=A0A1T4SS73_9HYPH|nr:urease accessory protein UreF [Consotaella salsifontis]SKA30748.1 urease accessory protein [Consotaella salsifontis]